MRFDEIARDLVHTASRLLRGRIVNIMDTSGVIVASTDAERIGTTHDGAREVMFPVADGVVTAVDIKAGKIVVNKKRYLEVAVL